MNLLNKIQRELKAPKSQFNKFGNYSYRNCEDILEAVKPFLDDATLIINDELVQVGDRYYVKATAILKDKTESWSATAYAREAQEQKGMNEAQITGSTSSYARKYALNALFAIDDTKDADNFDNTHKTTQTTRKQTVSNELPWLSETQYLAMLDAIEAGESDKVKASISKYRMKSTYLTELNKRLKA